MKKLAYRFSTVAFIIVLMAALLPVQPVVAAPVGPLYISVNTTWSSSNNPSPLSRDVVVRYGASLKIVGPVDITFSCATSDSSANEPVTYADPNRVDLIVLTGSDLTIDARDGAVTFKGATPGTACWSGIRINQGSTRFVGSTIYPVTVRDATWGMTFFQASGSVNNAIFTELHGLNQGAPGATYAGSAIGILVDGTHIPNINITSNTFSNIFGGNGSPVAVGASPTNNAGGDAHAIRVIGGSHPNIRNNNIDGIYGGIGGNGVNGNNGANATGAGDDGDAGQNGGNGANGGNAYAFSIADSGTSPLIETNTALHIYGGLGGSGGSGGHGGYGAAGENRPASAYETQGGDGGYGGPGGNGGSAGSVGAAYGARISNSSTPTLIGNNINSLFGGDASNAGLPGIGGTGGTGGTGNPCTSEYNVQAGWGGYGGPGGDGGRGGTGGNGGKVYGVYVHMATPVLTQNRIGNLFNGSPSAGRSGGAAGQGGLGGVGGDAAGVCTTFSGHGGEGGYGGEGGDGGNGGSAPAAVGIQLDYAPMLDLTGNTVYTLTGRDGRAAGNGVAGGVGGKGGSSGIHAGGPSLYGLKGDGGNGGDGGWGGSGGQGGESFLTGNGHMAGVAVYWPTPGFAITNMIIGNMIGGKGGLGGTFGIGGVGGAVGQTGNTDATVEAGDPGAPGGEGAAGVNGNAEAINVYSNSATAQTVHVTNNTVEGVAVADTMPSGGAFSLAGGIVAGDHISMTVYNNILAANDSSTPPENFGSVAIRTENTGVITEVNNNDTWNWVSDFAGNISMPDPSEAANIDVFPNFDDSLSFPDRFHLIFGAGASECVDGGWDMAPGLPQFDYHGTARIIDSNNDGVAQPDMGAYENGCYLEFEQTAFYKKRPFTNLPIKVLKTGDPTLFASATTYSSQHGTIDWVYSGGLAWASNDATPLYLTTSLYSFDYGGWFEITITPTAGCFIKPETSTVRVLIPQWFLPIQIQMP